MKSIKNFQVRAHHGMCLAYFIGKGYSGEFVINMASTKEYLETENPVVEIICGPDHICRKCPNNVDGICSSCGKVDRYDNKVLELCKLPEKTKMTWQEYSTLVKQQVLNTGKRVDVCGDCQWSELCHD